MDVEEGKRLVLAIEEDAKCTTCRVEFLEGEPEQMTRAELDVLQSRDPLGQARLSCQVVCDHDMEVRPLMTVTSMGLDGPGAKPGPGITPPPEWVEKPARDKDGLRGGVGAVREPPLQVSP